MDPIIWSQCFKCAHF